MADRQTKHSSSSSASKNDISAASPSGRRRAHHDFTLLLSKSQQQDAIREVLTAILELCGFWDHGDDTRTRSPSQDIVEVEVDATCIPRRQLIYSIQQLKLQAGRMVQLTTHSRHHKAGKLDDEATDAILQLEECISQVRSDISSYQEELLQQAAEMGDLVAELEHQPQPVRSASSVGRSIHAAFKVQIQKEHRALYQLLQSLDRFYNDESELETMVVLDQAMHCLMREQMLQRPDFLTVAALLEEGQSKQNQIGKQLAAKERLLDSRKTLKVKSTVDASVIHAESIWNAVEAFLLDASQGDTRDSCEAKVTCLLLVGEQGFGKTYVCDKVRTTVQQVCTVIYPKLPLDLLGSSLGDTEDTIVALIGAVRNQTGPAVLIVDGLEHLFSYQYSNSSFVTRSGSTFLSLLEATRQSALPGSRILILCTSIHQDICRFALFDRVFSLRPPNDSERRALIESILRGKSTTYRSAEKATASNNNADNLILDVVEATVGKSYAEIVQLCRQGIEDTVRADKTVNFSDFPTTSLCAIKDRLQTNTPESLKEGIIGDSFDMRILTSRDLLSIKEALVEEDASDLKYKLPMKGTSAKRAWKELERSIIVPLCQSKELNRLLCFKGDISERPLMGGILISGDAGSGKTELTMHCARYASHQLPNLKTLEVACTSLIHKEVGGSEQAIRRMFESARKATPCILILDGIENIAAVRGNDPTTEGTLDRVLSTLLTELDGVSMSQSQGSEGMVVIGITHNAALVDPALKRPGRLQKTIHLQRFKEIL